MVIGNGLLAYSFTEYQENKNILIFASGVSNSSENNPTAFAREYNLLLDTLKTLENRTLVYLSSCSIQDPSLQDSLYVQHKQTMEHLIIAMASKWYIFRLPQVVGPTNSPTLIHFLFESITQEKTLQIHTKATRNIIWYQDIFTITNEIISKKILLNQIINIASPYHLKIEEIVQLIENELQMTATKEFQSKGASYIIDSTMASEVTKRIKIFDDDYPKKVISKYAKLYKIGT